MSKTYQVVEPLSHDGKSYGPGDEVELNDKESIALLGTGVIAQVIIVNADEEAAKVAAEEAAKVAATKTASKGKKG